MIHLDKAGKAKLMFVSGLLAPMLAVQFVRLFVSVGPSAAPAAVPGATPEAGAPGGPIFAARKATPAQTKALAYLASHSPSLPLRSPMDAPDPPPIPPTPVVVNTPPPAPVAVPEPTFTLNGILGRAADSMASINHHIYRIGQEVCPGWRIDAIDSKVRTVTLIGPDGKTRVLSPDSTGH